MVLNAKMMLLWLIKKPKWLNDTMFVSVQKEAFQFSFHIISVYTHYKCLIVHDTKLWRKKILVNMANYKDCV